MPDEHPTALKRIEVILPMIANTVTKWQTPESLLLSLPKILYSRADVENLAR